jgi:hypothetical protein
MWIKKVFLSVWFRGVVTGFIPPLGVIGMTFLLIASQIATNYELNYSFNPLILLALSLFVLHLLINLVLPFAVSWKRAILAVIPTSILLLLFFSFIALLGAAMYNETNLTTFGVYLLAFFLVVTSSIVFARLGAWMSTFLREKSKS